MEQQTSLQECAKYVSGTQSPLITGTHMQNQIHSDSSQLHQNDDQLVTKSEQRQVYQPGNTNAPLDGYRWRKYGSKQLKNSQYPRGYFRCVFPLCPVRKQVQRYSIDNRYLTITYENVHNHLKMQPDSKRYSKSLAKKQVNKVQPLKRMKSQGSKRDLAARIAALQIKESGEGAEGGVVKEIMDEEQKLSQSLREIQESGEGIQMSQNIDIYTNENCFLQNQRDPELLGGSQDENYGSSAETKVSNLGGIAQTYPHQYSTYPLNQSGYNGASQEIFMGQSLQNSSQYFGYPYNCPGYVQQQELEASTSSNPFPDHIEQNILQDKNLISTQNDTVSFEDSFYQYLTMQSEFDELQELCQESDQDLSGD